MTTYSTDAYRTFKKFVGELTATAAGVHIGASVTVDAVAKMNDADPWSVLGRNYGIVVNGLKSEKVIQSTARLNIVSLYSGFDLFVASIRAQHFGLHGKEWKKHEGDAPFDEIRRNLPNTKSELQEERNKCRMAAIDYFRLVRNAVAHPSRDNVAAAETHHAENAEKFVKLRALYKMKSAPNKYEDLCFHDVKLFCQVALDLCQAIDLEFDPGDEAIACQIPVEIKSRQKGNDRIKQASIGCVKAMYGVSTERAERIFLLYMTR